MLVAEGYNRWYFEKSVEKSPFCSTNVQISNEDPHAQCAFWSFESVSKIVENGVKYGIRWQI